jgi:hypothetical protein
MHARAVMEINWGLFLPALMLLFYPLDNLLNGRARFRDYEGIANDHLDAILVWWRQLWTWKDPLRGFVGAWALVHAFEIEPELLGLWQHAAHVGILLVLAVAVGVQMHTRRIADVVLAPIGFCAGLLFALMSPQVAILVIASAGACLMAFRGWPAFFLCGSVAAGVLGFLISGFHIEMIFAVVVMIEPLLLSMLFGRPLRLPVVRKRIRVRRNASAAEEYQESCEKELTHQLSIPDDYRKNSPHSDPATAS